MQDCVKCDGSYPMDQEGDWDLVLEITEGQLRSFLGGKRVVNKEFRVIPRWKDEERYERWEENGRKKEEIYQGAIAVYIHDFRCYLIQRC